MKRPIRIALMGAGVIIVLFVAVICVALTVIDPNDHKAQIEALAYEATGKTLTLQGDLSLSVFPGISLKAGPAVLADTEGFGPDPFLKVDRVSASVSILPLLSGTVDIGDVEVSGARLKLAVAKDGKNNWSMGGRNTEEKTAPSASTEPSSGNSGKKSGDTGLASVALQSLSIRNVSVAYTDMRTGQAMELSVPKLILNNVKIGEKTSLELEATYAGATARPITLDLKAGLTLPASLAAGTNFTAEGVLSGTTFSCNGFFAMPQSVSGQELSLKGELAFGDINLDAFTAAPSPKTAQSSGGGAASNAAATPAKPANVSGNDDAATLELLRSMFIDLRITAKSLMAANVPVRDIKATIKADQGILTAKPVSMLIAGAPFNLEASVDAKGKTARTRITGDWKNANAGELVQALTGARKLSGALSAAWSLSASGLSWPAASRSLDGKASVELANGTLPAFQLIPSGVPGLPAKRMDITISRFSASWNIADGIARNNDLLLRGVPLNASGGGQVNIPAQTLNYKIAAELPTLPDLPNITVLPLVISGPLSSPSYGVDQPELLRQTARTILNPASRTGRELENVGKGLGGAVKGLLGK